MFNLYGFNIDDYVENSSCFVCARYANELTPTRNKGMWKLCYLEILKHQVFHFIKGLDCWVVKGLFQIVINLTFQSFYSYDSI